MTTISSQALHSNWDRVAREFSDADLKAHPNTANVMSYFSNDATFSQTGLCFSVGKFIASIAFKYLCENSVLAFKNYPEVTFQQKNDHIIWNFKSIQLRKGLLPEWISPPRWFRINNTVKLYFQGEGENTKISKFETIMNEWSLYTKN